MEYIIFHIYIHTDIQNQNSPQKKYEEEIDLVSKKKQNDINQLEIKLTNA